jgi:hypothetical protein
MTNSEQQTIKGMSERIVFSNRIEYRLNGALHRGDGPKNLSQILPAIEWADGTKEWYINGQLHREDGPAIEWANGTKEW